MSNETDDSIQIEYERQDVTDQENADFGIHQYSELENEFHKDIMELLEAEKYKKLPASSLPTIMARVYSTYMISQLEKEGKLERVDS